MHSSSPFSMMWVDHYRTLAIPPESNPEGIRAAYRALARRHHPDMPGGSDQRMRDINEAWEVLRDPARRGRYDQARLEREASFRTPPPARAEPRWSPVSGTVLDFGQYAGRSIPQLAREDPNYLRWLVRMPIGRRYSREVEEALSARAARAERTVPKRSSRGFLQRWL